MAHCWGGKMIDALKAVCELQLDYLGKSKSVVNLGHSWKFSDGAIPDFEAIFAGAGKSTQDEIHDILVHRSKPGIVEVGVFFEIERKSKIIGLSPTEREEVFQKINVSTQVAQNSFVIALFTGCNDKQLN